MPITSTEADKLTAQIALAIRGLVRPVDGKAASLPSEPQLLDARAHAGDGDGAARELARPVDRTMPAAFDDADKERLYQSFKARLLEELPVDPVLLALVVTRPEIRMILHPREVKLDTATLRGRIAKLITEGTITTAPIKRAEINAALSRTGPSPAGNRFAEALTSLVGDGILVRGDEDGIYAAAPGLKVTTAAIEATV